MAGLPRSAETTAVFLALLTLRLAERYELPARLLDVALERARREGHATRQGLIHGQRAAIALAQGSLHDAQVEAETGLLLVEEPHFAMLQLLAVAIAVHVERGALEVAAELAERVESPAPPRIAPTVPSSWSPVGACGSPRAGSAKASRICCGAASGWKSWACCGRATGGRTPPRRSPRWGRSSGPCSSPASSWRWPARSGCQGRWACRCAPRRAVIGGDEGLALLHEAVAVLEHSSARLELAHALADLGAELSRAGRRTEGRDAQRRAIKLAGQCGAIALAESAMAGLHAGPGRRARAELTGPGALTAAEWRVCRQAAEGHTNRELAQALFVTEKTVERHLSSAYQKLGIRSRFQLAAAIGE